MFVKPPPVVLAMLLCSGEVVRSQPRSDDVTGTVRALQARLAANPRQPDLLRALIWLRLARGGPAAASPVARRLAAVLPAGVERDAILTLLGSWEGKREKSRNEARLEAAARLRRHGETADLLALLPRLAGVPPSVLLYMRGELRASPGIAYDGRKAVAALRGFLATTPTAAATAALSTYLGRGVDRTELRRKVMRWLNALEAGRRVHPPPVVDAGHWKRREQKLARARAAEVRRIAVLQARNRRLQKQLGTVGDLRRKDGWGNRQTIRLDMRRNEKEIERCRQRMRDRDRELREASEVRQRLEAAFEG